MASLVRICLWIAMTIGLVIFVGSLVMFFLFPDMVADKVKEKLPLRNNSASLKKWSRVTVPIYFRVYVFDVQNPRAVIESNAIPELVERGPYVFLETRDKVLVDFENDSTIINYNDVKTYYFMPEMSNGSLSDEVNYVNVPLIGMIDKLKKREQSHSILGGLMGRMVDTMIGNMGEQVIMRRPVGDLLFDGYKVELFDKISEYVGRFGVRLPPFTPDNMFGVWYKKNGTSREVFTINSGVADIMKFNKVEAFRGRPKVPHWAGEYCNQINGTDGSSFHPQVTRDEILYIFNTDLCRSLFLDYEYDSEVRGIPTYKYTVPRRFFTAPANTPDNECFCTQPGGLTNVLCKTDGILDISKCRKGAPIVLSAPHFYNGDPALRANVSGLRPDKQRHETFLEIEPMTGLVLNAARRIQINVQVKSHPDSSAVSTVNSMIMPLLWVEEAASADETSANKFKSLIQNKLIVGRAILISGMAIGMAIFLVTLAILIFHATRTKSRTHFVTSKEDEAGKVTGSYSSLPQKDDFVSVIS